MTRLDDKARGEPIGLRLYRTASGATAPLARIVLNQRLAAGKEDAARLGERMGEPGRPRPDGPLFWIHGASVGESLSVLPLVERMISERPDLKILVTTGTVTSAKLIAERLPQGAIHQFIPIDHPRFVTRFLDHWRPDGVAFVESEFWPNLLLETRRRTPFMALVNGRVSPKSFEEWRSKPNSIRFLLAQFDLLLAQDRQNAERLSILAGDVVRSLGNLKNAAAPLPADAAALAALNDATRSRPFWLAASTHPGEEARVLEAHGMLKADQPGLLTMIAPRHPVRGDEIAAMAREAGFSVAQRSKGDAIRPDTQVYLADTLGELGIFYRATDVAFVGGSLVDKGGHNPLEPARLSVAILHGPHIFNFAETYSVMRSGGGAALVRNERDLAAAVRRLLADATTRMAMSNAARLSSEASGEQVLAGVVAEIFARFPAAQRAA